MAHLKSTCFPLLILVNCICVVGGLYFVEKCPSGYDLCEEAKWCCPKGYRCTQELTCIQYTVISTAGIVGLTVFVAIVVSGIILGVYLACKKRKRDKQIAYNRFDDNRPRRPYKPQALAEAVTTTHEVIAVQCAA